MSETERNVGEHVEREHGTVLEDIGTCASAVRRSWPDSQPLDGEAVRTRLRATLERAGVLERLSRVLAESVAAAGFDLPAKPVPAPPYVVVTSRGPVARATTPSGRIVIRFEVLDVERGDEAEYRWLDAVALRVEVY